jgi:NitT/TauT family transport system permease protein
MKRAQAWLDAALVIIAALAAWQLLSLAVGVGVLPPPATTANRLATLLGEPRFLTDLASTAIAFGIALAVAMAGGLVLGVAFGGWRLIGQSFEPFMHVVVATPKVTLYPVILLLFGLGDSAKIAFGVLHALPPVAIMTAQAIRTVRPVHRKTALVLRLSAGAYASRVLVPAVLPDILGAFRVCFAQALLGVLVGEMFASTRGLGHLLMASIGVDDNPTILAIVVIVFVFAGGGSAALLALASRRQG